MILRCQCGADMVLDDFDLVTRWCSCSACGKRVPNATKLSLAKRIRELGE